MYCAFIDFTKAFDSVSQPLLWYRLVQLRLQGRVLRFLQSMYHHMSSCVLTPDGLTEFFNISVGTRQGCILSPLLFVLYLNVVIGTMEQAGCQGIFIDKNFPNLLLLMYAADMSQLADTVGRLPTQLNSLQSYCQQWGLSVNIDKTKFMVFRNGGP